MGTATIVSSLLSRMTGQYQIEPLIVQVVFAVSSPTVRVESVVARDDASTWVVTEVILYANWTLLTVEDTCEAALEPRFVGVPSA